MTLKYVWQARHIFNPLSSNLMYWPLNHLYRSLTPQEKKNLPKDVVIHMFNRWWNRIDTK